MDTLKTLTYDVTGRIARITLNRPERGNGITFEMPAELAACVERANLDPSVHVPNCGPTCASDRLSAVGRTAGTGIRISQQSRRK